MNDTSPELRPADAGKPGMVETGLGAPVSCMYAGGEWRANGLANASRGPTKDLFLRRDRAVDPLLLALGEPLAWPAEPAAVVATVSQPVVAPLAAGLATWRFHQGRFSGGEAVGASVLSARLGSFLGHSVARPPDGAPAGGFPLLLRLEIRTGAGGSGAWRVLLVVREADIVSGWAQQNLAC